MCKQLILIMAISSSTSIAQETGKKPDEIVSAPNTITIQHRTTIEYTPDEIELNITLLEYVKTDPENQQTSTIAINELEDQLVEKLKPIGFKRSDLQLSDISDVVQPQNNGMYGVSNQLYTNTQKRLLRKTYTLDWKKSIDELQSFMEAMRFTGVQSIYINARVSDAKKLEINDRLMEQAMKETRERAFQLANLSGKTLGAVVSINIDPIGLGGMPGETVSTYPYINYNQYNNYYGSSGDHLSKVRISMVASIVFELIEK